MNLIQFEEKLQVRDPLMMKVLGIYSAEVGFDDTMSIMATSKSKMYLLQQPVG